MNYVTTKEYFLHFAYVVAILWELNVVADSLAFCAQEMRHSTDFMISDVKLRFSEFTKNLTKLPSFFTVQVKRGYPIIFASIAFHNSHLLGV